MKFQSVLLDKLNLTDSESFVLIEMSEGNSDKQIAKKMNCALATTQKHKEKIREKFSLTNSSMNKNVAILRYAISKKMIQFLCFFLCFSVASANQDFRVFRNQRNQRRENYFLQI